MTQCSPTRSEESQNWPEGLISVKITMSPYVFAMALEEAFKRDMRPWEFINIAIWEKLGKPDHDTLMEFAANLEIDDEDPKWMKRLKITARHEVEVAAVRKERGAQAEEKQSQLSDGDGDGS
jgi:hypothetical protein